MALSLTAGSLLAACGQASSNPNASPAQDHFEGARIVFAVPYPPGGGYDMYARTMAPHLEDLLGATVVVKNEPGAGGLLSLNKTEKADPNGYRIQIMEGPAAVASDIGGAPGARFDLREWGWIGRVAQEPDLVLTSPQRAETWEGVVAGRDTVRGAVAGKGGSSYLELHALRRAFDDFSLELVTGFEGGPGVRGSVIRGDTDVTIQSLSGSLATIEADELTAVAVFDSETTDRLPKENVPTILDIHPGPDPLLEQVVALRQMGRTVATAPGTDPAVLGQLRDAFRTVMNDPDFQKEVEEKQHSLDLMSGAEVEKLVKELYSAEGPFDRMLKQVYGEAS